MLWARAEVEAWAGWLDWASVSDAQLWQELGGHPVDHLSVSGFLDCRQTILINMSLIILVIR